MEKNEMADSIRAHLEGTDGLTEKKMFGGIGWMIGGNMAAGVHTDGRLMIRCSEASFDELIGKPGADAMRRGDKPMTGWVLVEADDLDGESLAEWVEIGRAYAESLPPK